MPAGCEPNLVGPATGAVAACAVLSSHLHTPGASARTRAPAPTHDLHAALSRLRRCFAATRPGSTLPGWPDWYARRVADLDARPALSPACPLSGSGARACVRWAALDCREAILSGA